MIDGVADSSGSLSLFGDSAQLPDGFTYREDFTSEAEEQKLIREIQKLQLTPFKYYQFTGKRRTVSFGWQYEFGASEITAGASHSAISATVAHTGRKPFRYRSQQFSSNIYHRIFHRIAHWLAP